MFCYFYQSYVIRSVYESSKMVVGGTYGCKTLQLIFKFILFQAVKEVNKKLEEYNPFCKNVGPMKVGN